jgi:TolB-like protein
VPDDLLASLSGPLAGRWQPIRELGRGGMAIVYLARDRKHDRDVALKVLRPVLAAALGAERFLREIQIAAQLNHPHILPLFDSGRVDTATGPLLYYVMPYVAGESLRDRLDRHGSLPIGEAVEIARQVAAALDYAHQRGVIHRDVKPENILLAEGQAVVSDFGIARAIDASATETGGGLTETGIALGTPRYMSPEQITGEAVTGASDVYSLGCVLFEMLAGAPPFDGPTPHAVWGKHTVEPAPSPRIRRPEVPRVVEDTVLTALAKEPGERFATAGAMGAALTGQGPTGGSARRRRRAAMAAGLAGGLALLGWGAALLFGPTPLGGTSVAVLYLDNRSRDSSDQYLADGITEELISRLGQVARLGVPSRGRVRRYRGQAVDDPAAIGRALGARYLVNGSIERGAAQLRVRVALVEAANGRQVWTRSFDQAGDDILATEDAIAEAVGREVVGRLAPAERAILAVRPTDNREAYDHYLKGNFYLSRRTSEADGRRALEEYQAALTLEPRFPEALARLGLVYGIYANWPWPYPGLTTDSLVARGFAAANRAIELDSASADGWLARGFLLIPGPADADGWDAFRVAPNLMVSGAQCWAPVPHCYREAGVALARAVRLDPRSAEIWYQYGRSKLMTPAADSAFAHSLELEPDRAVSAWLLGWSSLVKRRYPLAETLLDSAITLGRHDLSVYGLRAETRLALGDTAGARADVATVGRLVGGDSVAAVFHAVLATLLASRTGDSAGARARADSLVRHNPPGSTSRRSIAIGLAAALVAAGDFDEGLARLEGQFGGFAIPSLMLRSTIWDPVRGDPRFRAIVQRIEEASPR